jgi:hypothetical protein
LRLSHALHQGGVSPWLYFAAIAAFARLRPTGGGVARRDGRKGVWISYRVSGSSEAKTYGKGVALREHEKQPTLPRRSFFGKDMNERSRVFNAL